MKLLAALCLSVAVAGAVAQPASPGVVPLAGEYAREVDRQLAVPIEEQEAYGALLVRTLSTHGVTVDRPQFVLLVDRSPQVQAALLYWVPAGAVGNPGFVGATPVSTGKPGSFEHFETPLGVFAHALDNLDFRAEGTVNDLGIRGYGIRGRRVFDFGWQPAVRGWGGGGVSPMRLQLHATDPQLLEPRLGSRQSKGCIRTSGGFNHFLDLHGVLDGDYDEALARGERFWVLLPQRLPTPWAGRYLVIVDTAREARPAWSPWPRAVPASGSASGSASAPAALQASDSSPDVLTC